MKTLTLVMTETGFTWMGNENGYRVASNCILAVKTGRPISDPQAWLERHELWSHRRTDAIVNMDFRRGSRKDVAVLRRLGKKLGVDVKERKQP